MGLQEKIKELINLKEELSLIKKKIEFIEKSVISAYPNIKIEGVTRCDWGTITTKLIRTLDINAYEKIKELLKKEHRFVFKNPKIDLKKLREAERVFPKMVSACITTKPAKTVIKIK